MTASNEILNFWFSQDEKTWFGKNPQFDATLKDRFESQLRQAAAGELSEWQSTASSCLALVLLLDQVPRNIYRGTPESFAHDAQALSTARAAVARGFDRALPTVQRSFYYLPFEHSEDPDDQALSVRFHESLARDAEPALRSQTDSHLDYARRHAAVIARFGRFPHRNEILGRESTPEEIEFLKQPGSSF